MESIVLKISHVLLLALVCGVVFILIQEPYVIEKKALTLDIKQTSAENITIYENTDKLLCKYSAKQWEHFVTNKDIAYDFWLECEKEKFLADEMVKDGNIITAHKNIKYTDKKNNIKLKTQSMQYDLESKIASSDVFTNISDEKKSVDAKNGFKYDMKNEILELQNIKAIIKE